MPYPIEIAIDESKLSNMAMKLGAVIIDSNGKQYKGHNMSLPKSVSIHAEVDVLTKYLKSYGLFGLARRIYPQLSNNKIKKSTLTTVKRICKFKRLKADLIVVRVSSDGKLKCSTPCIQCSTIFRVCDILGIIFSVQHVNENGQIVYYNGISSKKCHTHEF